MRISQIIGIGSQIIKAKILRRRTPLKVTYHITYRCNLACPFCNRKPMINTTEMDTIQIKQMMKEFKAMGTHFWVFNGGEPLLREDLPELIDYAKNLGFHCSIVTNGILLAQRLDAFPSFRKLDFVQITLQGPKQIHERMCGQETYDRIIKGLNILKNLRIKINILTLISRDNVDYFDDLIKLIMQYRATIAFQPISMRKDAPLKGVLQFLPEREKYRQAVDNIIKKKREGAPVMPSFKYLEMIRNNWPDIPNGLDCYAGRLYCNVTPDGYLVPCCAKLAQTKDKTYSLKMGFQEAFRQLDNVSLCQDCYYFGPQEFNTILRAPSLTDIYKI